jgi:tRNA(Ser,Leu) C12 N-acetylase TAN1
MLNDWNVLVIGNRNTEDKLLEELEEDGKFEKSEFGDVLVGNVEDIVEFLEDAESKKYKYLNRVVPVEDAFFVSPGKIIEILKRKISKYVDALEPEDTFGVRVERRGMKEEISSQEIEREVGEYFYDLIEKIQGRKPKVNLKNPDKIIAIEVVGNRCGVGFITREMREKYSVIRVK